MGRRFAQQRFTDSRESIRKTKKTIFEALGQIRANRVFSPIRIEIRAMRVQSSLLSYFLEGRFAKIRSGPGKPNQKRSVHELFTGAFRNKSSM